MVLFLNCHAYEKGSGGSFLNTEAGNGKGRFWHEGDFGNMKTDVIIPVYKPGQELFTLLDRLNEQTRKPDEILLVNTEQSYFEQLVAGTDFWHRYKNVSVRHISKREFDHGGTRKKAVSRTQNDIFLMMTDDAIPADSHLIERLVAPIEEGRAQMSYARQLIRKDGGVIEAFTRQFNYPDRSELKTAADLKTRGIKAFFASDVCAAYSRAWYEKLGGFVKHTIFNEDMIFARRLLDAGGSIAYVADAEVYHSHNYTGIQQLKRNFDLGVSHAQYPEIFEGVATQQEGMKLVKETAKYLLKTGKPFLIFKLVWQSGCKYLGYKLGKNYRKLPRRAVLFLTMNREYWKV